MKKDKVTPEFKLDELKFSELSPYEKSLVEKTIQGGYSRRDVLKLMAVTGVSLVAAKNLLFTGSEAFAATPKKGGSVRMASNLHGPDDQLDPPPSSHPRLITRAAGPSTTAWFSTTMI